MNALEVLERNNVSYLKYYHWLKQQGFDEDVAIDSLHQLAQKLENKTIVRDKAGETVTRIATDLQTNKLEIKMAIHQEETQVLSDLLAKKKIKPKRNIRDRLKIWKRENK